MREKRLEQCGYRLARGRGDFRPPPRWLRLEAADAARSAAHERRHENGWIAIVVHEDDDGDVLISYARRPDGEPYVPPPPNRFEGGEDDYQERLARAQALADYMITMATGHEKCDCPPWPKRRA